MQRFDPFPSRHVTPRPVDVWLPPQYAAEPERRFPVLYMHDGQNLFDPTLSNTGIPWGVDDALTRVSQAGLARPAIVVGIWCTDRRWAEYFPQRALAYNAEPAPHHLDEETVGAPLGDTYLKFLVEELKPFIDRTLRTLPGPEDTVIMGSSMGGLCSLYALCEYPDVFGAAGCLSTHWPAAPEPLLTYVARHLPDPSGHRLYFDYGSEGLDAAYEPYQARADAHLVRRGFAPGRESLTLRFSGADHNEAAWRRRLEVPLRFLLPPAG